MYNTKNKIIVILVVIFSVLVLEFSAVAAEYPSKPITLIIPFTAGGSTDLIGRALAKSAEKILGKPIIIDNKAGAAGLLGPTLVLAKPPDGYTIGTMTCSTAMVGYHMGELNFHPVDDPTLIMSYVSILYGIVVRADSQWKTMKEFVRYAQENPNKISYATTGVGSLPHILMEELALSVGGIPWAHIPYKGASETYPALLGGHVDAAATGSGWGPLVEAGKFRILATFGDLRSSQFPKALTLKESGYNLTMSSPYQIIGPKGMPQPVIEKLHKTFKKAMEDPDFQSVIKKFDYPPNYLNSDDTKKFARQEFERMGKILGKIGLKKKQ